GSGSGRIGSVSVAAPCGVAKRTESSYASESDPSPYIEVPEHGVVGEVPGRNGTRIASHVLSASMPVHGSMFVHSSSVSVGNGVAGNPASRRFMIPAHTGIAACVAGPPRLAGRSKPTHTPAVTSGVKPTNHASRKSFVVPVLPATGRS